MPVRTVTPALLTPFSPPSRDDLPRFARDTNASRMAREQTVAQRAPSMTAAPLSSITNQMKLKAVVVNGSSAKSIGPIRNRKAKGPPQKPQLIKPLGSLNNPKSVKGMYYNPYTFRWEGNENEMATFDAAPPPAVVPSPILAGHEKDSQPQLREKENTTPRPALITNISSTQNVQIIGGMIFDPQRMSWFKVPSANNAKSTDGASVDGFGNLDEEEDVFKDVPDLDDEKKHEDNNGGGNDGDSALKDDWLVGEEFDVGPEFMRRQREEEERWRRKCEKWVGALRDMEPNADMEWRWRIRDVVLGE